MLNSTHPDGAGSHRRARTPAADESKANHELHHGFGCDTGPSSLDKLSSHAMLSDMRFHRWGRSSDAPQSTLPASKGAQDSQALDSFMAQFGPKKGTSNLEQLQQRLAAIYTDPTAMRQRSSTNDGGDSPHQTAVPARHTEERLQQRMAAMQRRAHAQAHAQELFPSDGERLLPVISRHTGNIPGLLEVVRGGGARSQLATHRSGERVETVRRLKPQRRRI